MSSMGERHCQKFLGCQTVTPIAPVKTTTMQTKPWRDLAVDLMGPLLTGESLLATVDNYLVSHEMEELLDELGIKHKKTIPLWPRAHGEVELRNKSSLKAMCAAQAEGKPWQQELQKYLLAYRSTPHAPTGVSPAEILNGRKIQTKMLEFEGD